MPNQQPWFVPLVKNDERAWRAWLTQADDVDSVDGCGMTALHWACFLQRSSMVDQLLRRGANPWRPDQEGCLPWQMAMRFEHSADWGWKDWPRRYALAFSAPLQQDSWWYLGIGRAIVNACLRQEWNAVQAWLSAIDVRQCPGLIVPTSNQEQAFSCTFIPWAHVIVLLNLDEVLPLMKAWGVSFNVKDSDGRTPLEWAIALENQPLVDRLIDAGAILPTLPAVIEEDECTRRPHPLLMALGVSPTMAFWASHRTSGSEDSQNVKGPSQESLQLWNLAQAVHGHHSMRQTVIKAFEQGRQAVNR